MGTNKKDKERMDVIAMVIMEKGNQTYNLEKHLSDTTIVSRSMYFLLIHDHFLTIALRITFKA